MAKVDFVNLAQIQLDYVSMNTGWITQRIKFVMVFQNCHRFFYAILLQVEDNISVIKTVLLYLLLSYNTP